MTNPKDTFPHDETEPYVQIKKKIGLKLRIFSYPLVRTFVLGAQKTRLIEVVLLSTHSMFWMERRK